MIQKLKTYKNYFLGFLGILILGTCILSLNTASIFPQLNQDRRVLSTLFFSPESNSSRYQVLKVKIKEKVIVEIYKIINEYNFQLVSQIDTGSKYDGYFLLGGSATNLAYINIDDDSANEIIVPGFDNNLTAHLNVIKFDSTKEDFTLLNQSFSLENR